MKITLDQGFQFGLGAFETIAVEQGKLIFLKKHMERFSRAANFLGLGTLEEREITGKRIEEYLAEQKPEDLRHSALKIMLSDQNVVFQMRENHYTEAQYEQGFVMDFSKVKRNETSPLICHKTMNYGDCILEKRAAAKAGMDERIFLNTKGEITEGTVSNIFFIRNGHLETPKISCGLLPGIMREYLCETEDVCETVIYPDTLYRYEECFITNSLMGIMPVRRLGNVSFEKKERTEDLRRKYLVNIKTIKIQS